jgi:alkanesulfonate monooxygenase SsuD/methylene tetrahydromethanopterin reductase-like flavin-dependent oxidoreductase (luciferase family)
MSLCACEIAAPETCEHLWHDGRVAITFDHWQSISDDTELKAAAAAAFVLGARLERLDIPPAQGMRDFDLVFSDGSREPIEITRSRARSAQGESDQLERSGGGEDSAATPCRAPSGSAERLAARCPRLEELDAVPNLWVPHHLQTVLPQFRTQSQEPLHDARLRYYRLRATAASSGRCVRTDPPARGKPVTAVL